MADISFEEKIDYIYKELKSQKRSRIFKIFLKLLIVGLVISLLHGLDKEKSIDSTTKFIGDIVKPITQNIVNDMKDSNQIESLTESIKNELQNNPDLLNKIK